MIVWNFHQTLNSSHLNVLCLKITNGRVKEAVQFITNINIKKKYI